MNSFEIKPRIVGGEEVLNAILPYIASLRDSKTDAHFCGGALISAKHVLTAGHCVNKRKLFPQNTYALLGIRSQLENGTRKNIAKITVHPSFDSGTMWNDIAVLTFVKGVLLTEQIQPIALPQSNVMHRGVLSASFSGWGKLVS